MVKKTHLMTSPVGDKVPNTTVNMIKETVMDLNGYCRATGQIRMYVLDEIVKDFLKKKAKSKK